MARISARVAVPFVAAPLARRRQPAGPGVQDMPSGNRRGSPRARRADSLGAPARRRLAPGAQHASTTRLRNCSPKGSSSAGSGRHVRRRPLPGPARVRAGRRPPAPAALRALASVSAWSRGIAAEHASRLSPRPTRSSRACLRSISFRSTSGAGSPHAAGASTERSCWATRHRSAMSPCASRCRGISRWRAGSTRGPIS